MRKPTPVNSVYFNEKEILLVILKVLDRADEVFARDGQGKVREVLHQSVKELLALNEGKK